MTLGAPPRICMVKFGNEATVQSDLLHFILTVQIDLDKQGNFWVEPQGWSPKPNLTHKGGHMAYACGILAVYERRAPASRCAKPRCCSTYRQN